MTRPDLLAAATLARTKIRYLWAHRHQDPAAARERVHYWVRVARLHRPKEKAHGNPNPRQV